MDIKLAILLLASALVNAQNYYERATPPKICNAVVKVMKGDIVIKNLCYIKQDLSYYFGSTLCDENKMRLYQPKSSPESWKALVDFGKSKLGGSSKAEVLVDGREGDKCTAFRGDGKLSTIPCDHVSYTICEYFNPGPRLPCGSYLSYTVSDRLFVACVFKFPFAITDPGTRIIAVGSFSGESILYLLMFENTNINYLPNAIVESFPNIETIDGRFCRISTLTYDSLRGLTELRDLVLNSNSITALDKAAFKDLRKLKDLNLSENPIKTISTAIFANKLPLLTHLEFSEGCIEVEIFSNAEIKLFPGSTRNTCIFT